MIATAVASATTVPERLLARGPAARTVLAPVVLGAVVVGAVIALGRLG